MGDRLGRGRAYTGSGADAAAPNARQTPRPPAADGDAAAGTRAERRQARRRQPAIVYGKLGHMIPTPGIGEPDGRKGIQDSGHADRRRSGGLPRQLAAVVCAVISVFVLGLLLYAMVRFRRGANPTPSRNSHNTVIEVIWTLVPVIILVAIALPSIQLLRRQYSPPPADLTVKVTGHQWYWPTNFPTMASARQLHAEGSRRPDPAGEPARARPTMTARRCSPPTSAW